MAKAVYLKKARTPRLTNTEGHRPVLRRACEAPGAPTIFEARDAEKSRLRSAARETPIVAAILEAFPAAQIGDLKTPEDIAAMAASDALAEVEDEWDPFENG